MKKILITGTGRAGTSFLMQLFTALDLDTGFDNPVANFDNKIRAGMEPPNVHLCLKPDSPKISKTPAYCEKLWELVERGLQVEHVIIPIRRLELVARSRNESGLRINSLPAEEQQGLAEQRLGQLMEAVALKELPYTFIIFPSMVLNPSYLFNKLSPIFSWADSFYPKFEEVFKEYAKPEIIKTK